MRNGKARVRAAAPLRRVCGSDFSIGPIGRCGSNERIRLDGVAHEGHIRSAELQYWSIARDGIMVMVANEVGRIFYIYY